MKQLYLTLLGVAGAVPALFSAPAFPGLITVTQPDGSAVEIRIYGDEDFSYASDRDGNLMVQDEAGFWRPAPSDYSDRLKSRRQATASPRKRMLNIGDVPTTGTLRGLVILAEYPDVPFAEGNDRLHFERLMNEPGYSYNGASGSVRDYYVDQSYGRFTPEFDVVGPVTLPNTMSYYGADTNGAQDPNAYRMIADACRIADETFDVDFSKYDNNGDGFVDLVYVVYSGYAQSNGASSYTIWPHMWFLSNYGAAVTLDGVTVDRYACSSERMGTSGTEITGIGLICHEFSHTLGLPDIYDLTGNLKKIAMGDFDVMDSGCYNNLMKTPAGYSSFEKASLGWLEPKELTEKCSGVELTALSENPEALTITSSGNPDEFYLLETRTRSSKWDRYLPGEGLLVVYVNYDAGVWDENHVNTGDNWRVHLVPASGDFSKTGDMTAVPFPGSGNVDIWGDRTEPSMRFSDGGAVGKPLSEISFDGETVRFNFGENLPAPEITGISDVTETGFRAHWNHVEGTLYHIVSLTAQSTGETMLFEKVMRDYYTFTRLDPEETYTYCVKVVNEALESPFSEARTIRLVDEEKSGISEAELADEYGVLYDLSGRRYEAGYESLPSGYYIRKNSDGTYMTVLIK